MDDFERRLRADAARIDATITPDLDDRLRASLASLAPARPVPSRHGTTARFWWTSSLTGLAAALAVIVVLNLRAPAPAPVSQAQTVAGPTGDPPMMPLLKTETAVLTGPLEQELTDLGSDIEKARKVVQEDLGF
jgi:hypothetical protein